MNAPRLNKKFPIKKILELLRHATKNMVAPALDQLVAAYGRDPFIILIGCLLSLRTRDTTTVPVAHDLFSRAKTPQQMVQMPTHELEKIIHAIGFYRKKALVIKQVSQQLLDTFDGKVPSTEEELLSLPGVGQKTAHAVMGYAFGIPALCVDTHVHQIANRLGWVATKTPEQTEKKLKELVPSDYWIELNYLFVVWGQNICTPISPWCSRCVIAPFCPKIGVKSRR